MPMRDYTLNYVVDTTQSAPKFAQIHNDLIQMAAELQAVNLAANGAGTSITNMAGAGAANLPAVTTHANAASQSFAGMATQALATAVAFQGLNLGVEIVQKVGESINSARDHMKELAEEAGNTRDALRELANLRGKDGPGDDDVGGMLKFGMGAGMNKKQAKAFLEQYEGSMEAGLDKGNVGGGRKPGESQDDYRERVKPATDEIALAGGRFGQRVKLQPKTAGDITGVLSQFGPVKDGEQALEKLGRMAYGENKGRGNLEPLFHSLANLAGGILKDEGAGVMPGGLEELAVRHGAASTHHNPREAATYVKKAVRELRQFTGKQGEGLKQMGITPEMSHGQAMEQVSKRLDQDAKLGKQPDQALRDMGFGDEAAIQAIIEEHNDREMIATRMKDVKQVTGAGEAKKNDAFFEKNFAGIRLQQAAKKDAQDWLQGRKNEPFQLGRAAAALRMRDSGEMGEGGAKWLDMVINGGGILPAMGIPDATVKRIDANAFHHLEQQAGKAGMADEFSQEWYGDKLPAHDRWEGFRRSIHSPGNHPADIGRLFDKFSQPLQDKNLDPFGPTGHQDDKIDRRADAEKSRPGAAAGGAQGAKPAGGPGPQAMDGGAGSGGGVEAILRALLDATHETNDEIRQLAQGDGGYNGGGPLHPVEPGRS